MEKITGVITNDNTLSGQITTQDNLSCVLVENVQVTGNIMETMLVGLSAYEIAVKNGFIGTEQEWLDSLAADSKVAAGDGIIVEVYPEDEKTRVISVSDEILNKADLDSPDFTGVPTAPTADINNVEDIHQIVNVEFLDNTLNKTITVDENRVVTIALGDGIQVPTMDILKDYATLEYVDENCITTDNFNSFIRENGLPYSLTIGDNVFNGTQDVVIPVYEGTVRE